ncbi:DNA-binding protein (fragment) [Magnetospirillum sp. UT-4]
MPMGQAHRHLTRLLRDGEEGVIEVPQVENVDGLIADLKECGIAAEVADPPADIDVQAVRKRTGYSQDQFALAYGLDVATLRNWEQGRTRPDLTARSYLTMIASDPDGMRKRRLQAVKAAKQAASASA